LLLIHIATYIYLRNVGNNVGGLTAGATSANVGYTGFSAVTPIFQNGITEFISLGFLILPLVMLMLIFWGGFWELSASIVALVFATVNFVVIFFASVGILIILHLNDGTPSRSGSFCRASDNNGNTLTNSLCTSQEVLTAGILVLLITQFIVMLLAIKATKITKAYFFESRLARKNIGMIPMQQSGPAMV